MLPVIPAESSWEVRAARPQHVISQSWLFFCRHLSTVISTIILTITLWVCISFYTITSGCKDLMCNQLDWTHASILLSVCHLQEQWGWDGVSALCVPHTSLTASSRNTAQLLLPVTFMLSSNTISLELRVLLRGRRNMGQLGNQDRNT